MYNFIIYLFIFFTEKIGKQLHHIDLDHVLIHAFITCRLDNGNALLYGLPKYQIQRLQSVQNCAARLVKRYPKFELHWLPVEHRIVFKILLLVFKSLNNLAPSYISDLLTPYIPSRSLRSSNQSLLVVPRSIQKSYGDRAFAVAAPRLWNALPIRMRQPGFSLAAFKKCLKTYLFKNAFFFKYFVISCDFCLNYLLLFLIKCSHYLF